MTEMVWVEFLMDHGCCWRKGQSTQVRKSVADTWIRHKIAKQIKNPVRDKMIKDPPNEKKHYYVG